MRCLLCLLLAKVAKGSGSDCEAGRRGWAGEVPSQGVASLGSKAC